MAAVQSNRETTPEPKSPEPPTAPFVPLNEFCRLACLASESKLKVWPQSTVKTIKTRDGRSRTVVSVSLAINKSKATESMWTFWKDNKSELKELGCAMTQRTTGSLPAWQASVWADSM